ncbi:hypothetical protein D3C71_991400 [compost metagenome]
MSKILTFGVDDGANGPIDILQPVLALCDQVSEMEVDEADQIAAQTTGTFCR